MQKRTIALVKVLLLYNIYKLREKNLDVYLYNLNKNYILEYSYKFQEWKYNFNICSINIFN